MDDRCGDFQATSTSKVVDDLERASKGDWIDVGSSEPLPTLAGAINHVQPSQQMTGS